jgi:hypothetical protein
MTITYLRIVIFGIGVLCAGLPDASASASPRERHIQSFYAIGQPLPVVRTVLTKHFGCQWQTPSLKTCQFKHFYDIVGVQGDRDGRLRCIDIETLAVRGEYLKARDAKIAKRFAFSFVEFLVPGWRNADRWLARTAKKVLAEGGDARRQISIGNLSITMQRFVPADIPGIYVFTAIQSRSDQKLNPPNDWCSN